MPFLQEKKQTFSSKYCAVLAKKNPQPSNHVVLGKIQIY